MIVLNSDPMLGFVLHPKTASRSVERALKGVGAVARRGRHTICPKQVELIKDSGGFIYGTVRNPLDVLVSWYHYKLLSASYTPRDWPSFLDLMLGPGLPDYIVSDKEMFYARPIMDGCIRFENDMQEQLNMILNSVGVKSVELRHLGQSEDRKPWQEYYTQADKYRVLDRFRPDFENFWYGEEV